MARKFRVEYPGAVYHVVNRGDRREEILKDDADRERFLEALVAVCVKTGWQVQALCLIVEGDVRLGAGDPAGVLSSGEAFRRELLAQMTERRGGEHYGAERLETDVAKTERVVREELRARRWQEAGLARRAKGDLDKVKIAARLREETLVTVKWIATRLGIEVDPKRWTRHRGI